jgi:hypothetical protein
VHVLTPTPSSSSSPTPFQQLLRVRAAGSTGRVRVRHITSLPPVVRKPVLLEVGWRSDRAAGNSSIIECYVAGACKGTHPNPNPEPPPNPRYCGAYKGSIEPGCSFIGIDCCGYVALPSPSSQPSLTTNHTVVDCLRFTLNSAAFRLLPWVCGWCVVIVRSFVASRFGSRHTRAA